MTNRDRVLLTLVAVQLILTVTVSFIVLRDKSSEGATRYPECVGHVEGVRLCEVAGSDLFSASSRMEGRLIRVAGYLAVDHGVVSLYPSEHDYLHRMNNHALVVRGSIELQRQLFRDFAYRYVRLIGTYRSGDEGSSRTGRIGALHVQSGELVPPRGEREDSDRILINVEDLNE